MIDKEACFLLGKIRKSTGFRGEVLISMETDVPANIDVIRFLHLFIDGGLIPFMIEEAGIQSGRTLRVRFTDVPDQEKARRLTGCEVYIEAKDFQPVRSKGPPGAQVSGYRVSDLNKGEIGTADEIIRQEYQDLLLVRAGDAEILIPLVPAIIIDIDHKRKSITVDLPEGLADLNA